MLAISYAENCGINPQMRPKQAPCLKTMQPGVWLRLMLKFWDRNVRKQGSK